MASSISDNGKIAGFAVNGNGERFMASWDGTSGLTSPLAFIPGLTGNKVTINNAGAIAYTAVSQPFLYSNGASQLLPCSYGGALCVNQLGDVVGSCNNGFIGSYQGTMWKANNYGALLNIGAIFGGQFLDSGSFFEVNSNRRAVGYVLDGTITRAIYWDADTGSPTHILPQGVYSAALAVNEYGAIVGRYQNSLGQYGKPFLYEDGVFHDLQSEIDPANGWYLTEALGINEFGQICGFGYLNGRPRGYLLTPANQPPVATDDYYVMDQASSLSVPAPGVQANDSDPDEDALTASLVSGPSHAVSFHLNGDGSFTYTPQPYFYGTDTFTYKVNDGSQDSNVATVSISVAQPGAGGFITGGGKYFDSGRKCTFGFVAKVLNGGVQGNLEYQDHDSGLNVKSTAVLWVYAPNQTDGYFSGTCTVNGSSGYTFFVQLHDRGEPGRNDDFTVWVFGANNSLVSTSGGTLASGGNIQIHG